MQIFKSADPVGNIIFLPKEKILLRGIKQQYSDDMKNIIAKCATAGLLGKSIVQTRILPEKYHADFDICLQHELIDPFIYPSEWSSEMLYDAGVAVLDLLSELDSIELTVKDCHLHNIAYYKGKFVWIDFGSFANNNKKNINPINGFRDFFVNTVIYASQVNLKKMLHLLKEDQHFSKKDIVGHLSFWQLFTYNYYNFKASVYFRLGLTKKVIQTLRCWLRQYKQEDLEASRWVNYQQEQLATLSGGAISDGRSKTIVDFIEKIKPRRILDVGGNAGFFCFLAKKFGAEGIVFDIDNGAINLAYRYIKNHNIQNVTPLIMDFLYPTPALSMAGACEDDGCIALTNPPAKQRLKSDMVLGLALVHHLVFFQQVSFEEIIQQFASFTTQYLIVEFVHSHDIHVSKWNTKQYPWYNLENFLEKLRLVFDVLKMDDCLLGHRTLIFCKLK